MSSAASTLQRIIALLNHQPDLFNAADRDDLQQRLSRLPDSLEDLSDALLGWFQTRPSQYSALLGLSPDDLYQGFTAVVAAAAEVRLPGNAKQAPPLTPEQYKQLLLNAMHREPRPNSPTPPTQS